jgi:hypothetical protein
MCGAGDIRAFPYGSCCIPLQPALAYVNWARTLVLSEGRDSITPWNTTTTRCGVGGGGDTEVCWKGELLKADKESTDLWNVCRVGEHT